MSGGHPRLTGFVSVPQAADPSPSPSAQTSTDPATDPFDGGSIGGQDGNISAVIPSIPGVNAPGG
jgi:hypothetical protein